MFNCKEDEGNKYPELLLAKEIRESSDRTFSKILVSGFCTFWAQKLHRSRLAHISIDFVTSALECRSLAIVHE